MKKTLLLNQPLSAVIASMGHTDGLVVCDAGLPIPGQLERIDLAVSPGVPELIDVLRAIASELQVERLTVAEELAAINQPLVEAIANLFPAAKMEFVPHQQFKVTAATARAIVRSGECTPYANVILWSGVTF